MPPSWMGRTENVPRKPSGLNRENGCFQLDVKDNVATVGFTKGVAPQIKFKVTADLTAFVTWSQDGGPETVWEGDLIRRSFNQVAVGKKSDKDTFITLKFTFYSGKAVGKRMDAKTLSAVVPYSTGNGKVFQTNLLADDGRPSNPGADSKVTLSWYFPGQSGSY